MSLSTSRFEPFPRIKNALATWAIAFSLVLVVIAVNAIIVAVVDPFNSQFSEARLRYDRLDRFRRTNIAQWAAFEIEADRAEVKDEATILLLGDSRAEMMAGGFKSTRHATVGGKRVYSLAFGGSSLKEQLDLAKLQVDSFPSAETILLTIPYEKLVVRDRSSRIATAVMYAKWPILYLTDLNQTARSFKVLMDMPPRKLAPWKSTRPNNLPTDAPLCESGVPSEEEIANVYASTRRVTIGQVREVVFDLLKPFVHRMNSGGIEVAFVIPPWPPSVAQALEPFDLRMRLAEEELSQLGQVIKIPPAFTEKMGWQDVRHPCSEAALQMLDLAVEAL